MKNWMDEFVNNTDLSQNRPLKEVVYESIRKTLIETDIPLGERFIEKEYSERLNISRTPVRESLKQLEQEGLVEYVHRCGVVVNKITKEDVIEIYKIRQSLELLILKGAMENILPEEIDEIRNLLDSTEKANNKGNVEEVIVLFGKFNSLIYKASKMKRLPAMISNLNSYLQRFRNISIEDNERREKALLEHRLILESIITKDESLAEATIRKHLDYSLEVVISEFNR